jgi:CRP-like cAMP-binding protein
MFKKNDLKKLKKQGNIVFNSSLLKNLNALERYEILQLCHHRTFKAGEYILYKDDPGTGMYFIQEGTVRLSVNKQGSTKKSDSESSESQFSTEFTNPAEFGLLSIGYEIQRLYTAYCVTDCKLLGFFKPDFETLKKRHPETAVKFLEAISTKSMKQLEQTMKVLTSELGSKKAFDILLNSEI